MVEENSRGGKDAVFFAEIAAELHAFGFGDAVYATRVELGGFTLRFLIRRAEDK